MKRILFDATFAALATTVGLGLELSLKPRAATAAKTSNEELNLGAYIELLRTDINKEKSRIMGDVMELDADQAATSCPIDKNIQNDSYKTDLRQTPRFV